MVAKDAPRRDEHFGTFSYCEALSPDELERIPSAWYGPTSLLWDSRIYILKKGICLWTIQVDTGPCVIAEDAPRRDKHFGMFRSCGALSHDKLACL